MVPVEVAVVYVLRAPRYRPPFLALMAELRPVTTALMRLTGASARSYTLLERDDRQGWFIEVLEFAGEQERAKFDDLYSQDRRAAAIQGLLDELLDATKSDYVVVRGADKGRAPLPAYLRRVRDRAGEVPME
jgi:hypothetical protein